MRRRGFTLIEVLVASLLLSMLVVILTMVFNQSSIAWRTGKANVAEMDEMRRRLSQIQRQADDVLFRRVFADDFGEQRHEGSALRGALSGADLKNGRHIRLLTV